MISLLTGAIIGLHLVSTHIPARDHQNNVNPGVYVELANGFTAGAYRNTLSRTSVYAGWTFTHDFGPAAVSLTVGAITGYQRKTERGLTQGYSRAPLTPMAAPSVRVQVGHGYAARVTFIPGISAIGSSVVHLSVERQF